MDKTKNRKILRLILLVSFAAMFLWVLWANTAVEMTTITLQETQLPPAFDGFRVAHISDFHSASMGSEIIKMLRSAKPDIICVTGDLMDLRDNSAQVALAFMAEAVKIAPCYYITGNHEVLLPQQLYTTLMDGLKSAGVCVMDDEEVVLTRQGDSIAIVGHSWGNTHNIGSISGFRGYRILLSHQPEDMDNYVSAGFDLVLSGHAHGGQFRLPLLGGIYAPGQGFFPKYDSGVYSMNQTDMIVSRGIGNSIIPLRFNNRPEVIMVVLEAA